MFKLFIFVGIECEQLVIEIDVVIVVVQVKQVAFCVYHWQDEVELSSIIRFVAVGYQAVRIGRGCWFHRSLVFDGRLVKRVKVVHFRFRGVDKQCQSIG
ncbi:hypothetical protein E4T81_07595 [Barnesiella sp. WM24]|nr:hypothetical protein E4T81_07595 [Barnesiella sp. WM24]